ncbi:MAG TPA: nucleoside-diphosphate sugar epimerase/dehydratase [Candidatus Eisenbacteria bacterium]|nr:nucleoside-diphosphate sugar epimerase/dehydratase [Candidatus Eisenbacteria bacterium]
MKNKHLTRYVTPRKFILIVYDISATLVAALLSLFVFYFERDIPEVVMQAFKNSWFIYLIVGGIIFYLIGFFDQMWAFASFPQYVLVTTGALVHTVTVLLILQILKLRLPYVIYFIYWFILTIILLLIRLAYRWYSHYETKRKQKTETKGKHVNVLIVGAGRAGSQIITELRNQQVLRKPIAIVDDNPLTHTYKNMGIPVLGDRYDIPKLVEELNIDEIIIAIPSASNEAIREIIDICRKTNVKVKRLPFYPDILADDITVQLSDLREIDLEDLLGREPIKLELEGIDSYLNEKAVLVTGGGGSIGAELARQIAKFKPSMLILFDIYENNVYELQQELKSKYGPSLKLQVQIGSVRDKSRLEQVFAKWRPNVVFHAAAHKHVPLMEDSPEDAVKNNFFGSYNVGEVAGKYGTNRMVLISTDKAVNPTNVMGATKRLAEMAILALNNKYPHTCYSAVRFGNVLGSSGSVIPLFKKQIDGEHRVTVTHPDIERFFMTIPEASRLVLQAGSYANDGEIFVLDMGEPVKIIDLAKELIRLSGYEPFVDIPIDFIGLRPGEKMYEELYLDEEYLDKTAHEKIFTLLQNHNINSLEEEIESLLNIIKIQTPKTINKTSVLLKEIICLIDQHYDC